MSFTYVLAGHDHNEAFKDDVAAYQLRAKEKGDVLVIEAKPGESIENVMAQIKNTGLPGNIVLLTHGNEFGFFTWTKDKAVGYSWLFNNLPRAGIESITIASCYGGMAAEDYVCQSAPPGMLVQSTVGAKVYDLSDSGKSTRDVTSYPEITSLSLLLEALEKVGPATRNQQHWQLWSRNPDVNPNDVLPHIIGLGGHPPIQIDLNTKITDIFLAGANRTLDRNAFKKATAEVEKHFNDRFFSNPIAQRFSEQPIDKQIATVAHKLGSGASSYTLSLREKRLAYALAAAYLHTSGEMDRLVAKAQRPPEAMALNRVAVAREVPPPQNSRATTKENTISTTSTQDDTAVPETRLPATHMAAGRDVGALPTGIANSNSKDGLADNDLKPQVTGSPPATEVSLTQQEMIEKKLVTNLKAALDDPQDHAQLNDAYYAARSHFAGLNRNPNKLDSLDSQAFRASYEKHDGPGSAQAAVDTWRQLEADASRGLAQLMHEVQMGQNGKTNKDLESFVEANRAFLDTDKDGNIDHANAMALNTELRKLDGKQGFNQLANVVKYAIKDLNTEVGGAENIIVRPEHAPTAPAANTISKRETNPVGGAGLA